MENMKRAAVRSTLPLGNKQLGSCNIARSTLARSLTLVASVSSAFALFAASSALFVSTALAASLAAFFLAFSVSGALGFLSFFFTAFIAFMAFMAFIAIAASDLRNTTEHKGKKAGSPSRSQTTFLGQAHSRSLCPAHLPF